MFRFSFLLLRKKGSHQFKCKILLLSPGQIDISIVTFSDLINQGPALEIMINIDAVEIEGERDKTNGVRRRIYKRLSGGEKMKAKGHILQWIWTKSPTSLYGHGMGHLHYCR